MGYYWRHTWVYEPLCRLLTRLGYEKKHDVYQHPAGRRVLFLGDLIDRGPGIPEVFRLVRSMQQQGHAAVILGNHELNLLGMLTKRSHGTYARAHKANRMKDFNHTCAALAGELDAACSWFRTLPVCLEVDGLRAVHAAWVPDALATIRASRPGNTTPLSDEFLITAFDESSDLFYAVETVLKGCEVALPNGASFRDFSGHVRTASRVQWYRKPSPQETVGSWAMPPDSIVCEALAAPLADAVPGYALSEPPCFVGHYWLSGTPAPLTPNLACLDYGVARGPEKGGDKPPILAAYRFDGETRLDPKKFVWVPGRNF